MWARRAKRRAGVWHGVFDAERAASCVELWTVERSVERMERAMRRYLARCFRCRACESHERGVVRRAYRERRAKQSKACAAPMLQSDAKCRAPRSDVRCKVEPGEK